MLMTDVARHFAAYLSATFPSLQRTTQPISVGCVEKARALVAGYYGTQLQLTFAL